MSDEQDTAGQIIEVQLLDGHRWADLEKLFGPNGATEGCWCMHWRAATAAEYESLRGDQARKCFKGLVVSDTPTGVIGYDSGGEPVGWCSVAPRSSYGRRLKRIGWTQQWDVAEDRVWSIVCFYLAGEARGQGNLEVLISRATDFARDAGASIIEAYPNDTTHRRYSAGELYMGTVDQFLSNGFDEVDRPAPGRVTVTRHLPD